MSYRCWVVNTTLSELERNAEKLARYVLRGAISSNEDGLLGKEI